MRKQRPIDALFPKIRQGVLAATYGQPERWWFLSELSRELKTTPSSLQRELQALAASGLLRQRRDGRRLYFQAEVDSPIAAPLREIIAQSLGLAASLKEALSPLADKIKFAFVYGSIARSEEHALSDVDVMVIGSVGLADLSAAMLRLERRFDREFNVSCYSTDEFKKKAIAKNHFLTSVLQKEKIFLIGDENELDRLTE